MVFDDFLQHDGQAECDKDQIGVRTLLEMLDQPAFRHQADGDSALAARTRPTILSVYVRHRRCTHPARHRRTSGGRARIRPEHAALLRQLPACHRRWSGFRCRAQPARPWSTGGHRRGRASDRCQDRQIQTLVVTVWPGWWRVCAAHAGQNCADGRLRPGPVT